MRIAYYCQHVLGVGHFHRSLAICQELAHVHEVVMITGGAPVTASQQNFSFFQLPGLVMDENFKNLAPFDGDATLVETKKNRAAQLLGFISSWQPEVFVVELYPFGRKAFRFELDPVLEYIRKGPSSNCLTLCSVRDILVERDNQEKFEKRVVATLNTFFDGVLIHGDEQFIPLGTTFSKLPEITIPRAYTGYVTPSVETADRREIRENFNISPEKKLVLASIGGGGVGVELLYATQRAIMHLGDKNIQLQIFTGPYTREEDFQKLRSCSNPAISVNRFSSEFGSWLHGADLSVSMAGYNTTMNILAAGAPALLYPFSQNREQRMRISKLREMVPFIMLEKNDLLPELLAKLLRKQMEERRYLSPISLNGAAETAAQIEHWHRTLRN